MYTLKLGDYEYIFEYDTEEEFQKRKKDTIELHKELVELQLETLKYKEANKVLKTLENKPTQTNRIKWAELEGKFIAYQKDKARKKVSKATYKAWASTFNKLKNYFGRKPIDSITFEDYEDFVIHLETVEKLNPKTINKHITYTNKFLEWAVTRKLITENNIKNIEKFEEEKYEGKKYTNKEIQNILAQDFPQDYRDIFHIAIYTGMRVGEICNLKNEDIKKDEETGIYYFVVEKSKTNNGERHIPIHKNILNRVLEIDFPLLKDKPNNDAKQKAILRQLYTVVKKGNKQNFHSFRKTFIHNISENNKNSSNKFIALIIQEIVGHSKNEKDALTFDTYKGGFSLQDKKEAIDNVDYFS